MKKQKMPRDVNQRAKATLDLITGERAPNPEPVKDPRSVELGRLGGLKGGKARAAKLSREVHGVGEMVVVANRPRRKPVTVPNMVDRYDELPLTAIYEYPVTMSEDEALHEILKATAERYEGANWRETFKPI